MYHWGTFPTCAPAISRVQDKPGCPASARRAHGTGFAESNGQQSQSLSHVHGYGKGLVILPWSAMWKSFLLVRRRQSGVLWPDSWATLWCLNPTHLIQLLSKKPAGAITCTRPFIRIATGAWKGRCSWLRAVLAIPPEHYFRKLLIFPLAKWS